ncbi:MAG: hypothetical protein IJX17_02015 [Clostridia bacterium]|nr:hypothetical protein [Clostridia bacterium]
MEKLNFESDIEKYKKEGPITNTFLNDPEFNMNIHNISNNKQKLLEICKFIHKNKHITTKEPIYISKTIYQKYAEQIWSRGIFTGSYDHCLVFATIARSFDIPTALLFTANLKNVKKIQKGKIPKNIDIYVFCECYIDNKWVLIDTLKNKIYDNYDYEKISLGTFSSKYTAYQRNVDLGSLSSPREVNENMINYFRTLVGLPHYSTVSKISQKEINNNK